MTSEGTARQEHSTRLKAVMLKQTTRKVVQLARAGEAAARCREAAAALAAATGPQPQPADTAATASRGKAARAGAALTTEAAWEAVASSGLISTVVSCMQRYSWDRLLTLVSHQ